MEATGSLVTAVFLDRSLQVVSLSIVRSLPASVASTAAGHLRGFSRDGQWMNTAFEALKPEENTQDGNVCNDDEEMAMGRVSMGQKDRPP